MLRGIRKASANWLGRAVLIVVMGLLIVSFAIWGIGDIFRGFGRATVARVGNTEVTIEQFRQIYNDRLQQLGRRLGRPITMDQARAIGLDQQVLGELIAELALDDAARRLRLAVPAEEIARRITEDPAFRGVTGQFDRARFEQLIRSAGYTESRFVAEQRSVLLRRQLAESIVGDLPPPRTMLEALYRYENEQRAIEYVVLDERQAGDLPAPTPEVLAGYFEQRKAAFRAPEYRKVVVLALTAADSARWITVSDADARRAYDDRRDRYVTPERRQVHQIVFANIEEAKAAADRMANGESFLDIASQRGLKLADIDLGLVAKSAMLDPAVAEAAFSLSEGAVSQPIEGRFGTVLVQVVKIEPERVRTFEEVAPEIKREIALDRAKTEVLSLHDKVEDELAAGQQLTEIGQKLGVEVRVIPAIDRAGRDPAGNQVADLPAGVDLVTNVFASQVGIENEPLSLPGGGYLWYEVAEIVPARERSLDDVRDRVEARWREEQIAERLKTKAGAMLEKLKAGTSLAQLASDNGLKVESASGLKRGRPPEGIAGPVVEAVFRTAKGDANAAEGRSPAERIVLRVTDVLTPAFDPTAPEAKRAEETLRRSYGDILLGEYLTQVQSDIGITVNQSAFRQVVGGETN